MNPSAPFVEAVRGMLVEARHPFAYAIVDADRTVHRTAGRPRPTPWRSAAKPFQVEVALECLDSGLREALLADASGLALAAASHSAEPTHVAGIDALLHRLGLGVEALRCGTHRPMNEGAADTVLRAGGVFDARHNNCSGKHALMAAAAAALGAAADYRPADHPLQRRIAARIAELCGGPVDTARDGCGVPTFGVDVVGMARAYAALARPATRIRGAVADAMRAHPFLTSGTGRFDLLLAQRAQEPLIGKVGALGVFCIALPDRGLGIAVKMESGATDALPTAVEAVLDDCAPGLLATLPPDWPPTTTRNVVGDVVGGYRAVLLDNAAASAR